MKYTQNDTGNFINKGYKVKAGDTIKFGRVRFKVSMLSNAFDGDQLYQPYELLKRKKTVKKLENTDSEEESDEDEDDDDEGSIARGQRAGNQHILEDDEGIEGELEYDEEEEEESAHRRASNNMHRPVLARSLTGVHRPTVSPTLAAK